MTHCGCFETVNGRMLNCTAPATVYLCDRDGAHRTPACSAHARMVAERDHRVIVHPSITAEVGR